MPRQNREPPVGAHTRLCSSTRTGIEVPSHDPLQNFTDVLFSCKLFLGYLSLYLFVEPDTIGFPLGVVQRITFEEYIADMNINRLQEMVDM